MDTERLMAIRKRLAAATQGRLYAAIVDPALDPAEWFKQSLSFGSGDIHAVIALDHPMHRGPDDRPAHAVTVAVTGNGPAGVANAELFIHASIDLADLCNEVERLSTQVAFFRAAFEDASNNKREALEAIKAQYEEAEQRGYLTYTDNLWSLLERIMDLVYGALGQAERDAQS